MFAGEHNGPKLLRTTSSQVTKMAWNFNLAGDQNGLELHVDR